MKRDESSANAEFIVQDLPYHVKRVFLEGTNNVNDPWFIRA
jgi:hypothetical protein